MSNDLGIDRSGNGNNWTVNNITNADQVVDSPTNNFATFNPLDPQGTTSITFSEGNLKVVQAASWTGAVNNVLMTSGKWYWEYSGTDMSNSGVGVIKPFAAMYNGMNVANNGYFGAGDRGYGINFQFGNAGDFFSNTTKTTDDYLSAYSNGDVIGVAYDADTGKIWIAKNNTWGTTSGGLGNPSTAANPAATVANPEEGYYAGFVLENCTIVANFGQDSSFAGNKTAQGNQDGNGIGDFYYTPPTGFLALCTKNLPDVAVTPSEHFNTILFTGDGTSNRDITGTGFNPDFNWLKMRSGADNHVLTDVMRGTNHLHTNDTSADSDLSYPALITDGFRVSGGTYNNNSSTFVAWQWKANGSGSTNTAGSVNSTVSANVDAGFSIVSYTATANTHTFGHGLSQAPEFIYHRMRDVAGGGNCYLAPLGTGNALRMDESTAAGSDSGYWPIVNSTLVKPGAAVSGAIETDYIAYCFHSVDGYSSIGSYVGNSNADGTFVYTGFRVKWLLVRRTDGSADWLIFDAERNTFNVVDKFLEPNTSDAEATESTSGYEIDFDFTSNGFKLRGPAGGINNNGSNYIYMAFAETPFKYSNAR